MRSWRFSKPKTPGFGISGSFFLSVLSTRPTLPSVLDLINPAGANGAVVGLGAPLREGAQKSDLAAPLERGAYAIASKDRKTVLKMLVLSKDEAGFDSERFAQSELALGASEELVVRVRATWTLAQLTFESHDPMVYPALDFVLDFCGRFGNLADGAIADPVSKRYLLPENLIQVPRLDPKVDAREHVTVRSRVRPDGLYLFTLGMQKFALPEFEMINMAEEDLDIGSRFMIALCQDCLLGRLVHNGDRFGSLEVPFEARDGGFDLALWEGIKVLELLPPTSSTTREALDAWTDAVAKIEPR